MNKLLATIILLCFSFAANADVFFCETERISGTSPVGGEALEAALADNILAVLGM